MSDDQLHHGVEVTVTGRPDKPGGKLKERERAVAVAAVNSRQVPVEAGAELYFGTDDPTPAH